MPQREYGIPNPRETITTIPKEEESGINILYTTLISIGYDLTLEEQPENPSQLKVTTDPETARNIKVVRAAINHGELKENVEAILEPWDGLIDEVARDLDLPDRVHSFLNAPTEREGSTSYTPLEQLFVLAYQKGRYGEEPLDDAEDSYGQLPFRDEKSAAVRARLKDTYDRLIGRGVAPMNLTSTQELLNRVIKDFLKPRPQYQPAPRPTEVQPQG